MSRALALVSSVALLWTAACAGWEPLEVHNPEDMREGPGLFSGDDGELAVEVGLSREPGETEEEAEKRRTDESRN